MLKINLIVVTMIAISCAGNPPAPKQRVKVWNGAPEVSGICRLDSSKIASETIIPKRVVEPIIEAPKKGISCIPAASEDFKKYACMTFDDLSALYEYSEQLIRSCKQWK